MTKSFDEIFASLNKDTLAKVKRGSEISKEFLPTASYGFNRMFGGFHRGKQHTIYGSEQSAKSGVMLQTVALNQKLGANIAWIDAEHSFDPEWAAKLGVDPDQMLVTPVATFSEATNLQVELIQKGFDMIVIDSTGALMATSFIDKGGDLKDFDDTMQLGSVAKDMGKMCKMVQGINFTCAIVHISQVRIDIASPGTTKPFKAIGGKESEHADSLRIRLSSSKSEAKAIMGNTQYGDVLLEEKHGIPVAWKIDKNKLNGNYGTGDYNFYIKGDHLGVDYCGELVNMAVTYDIIQKGGAWFTVFGERFQGEKKVIDYLRENDDIREKVELELANIV